MIGTSVKQYPTLPDIFATWQNDIDNIAAEITNDLQDQLLVVENTLGTNIAGTQTDLKTRLAVVLNADGSLKSATIIYGSNPSITIGTDVNNNISIGWDSTNTKALIQTIVSGLPASSIILQPLGGSVGIGTTIPLTKFHIHDVTGSHFALSGSSTVDAGIWLAAPSRMSIADSATGDKGIAIDLVSGNVGIGSKSPQAKLDLNGQIQIRGGSPSAGYLLLSDANGLASWANPTTIGANWVLNGTDIYKSNSGNVGIGTSTPSVALDVIGDIKTTGNLTIGSNLTVNGTTSTINTETTNTDMMTITQNDAQNALIVSQTNIAATQSVVVINNSGSGSSLYVASGNVGIGVTSTEKLNIDGNIYLLNGGVDKWIQIGSSTNYSYRLQSTGDDFQIIETGGAVRLHVEYPNGYVGIGTTIPLYKLHVAGHLGVNGNITSTGTSIGLINASNTEIFAGVSISSFVDLYYDALNSLGSVSAYSSGYGTTLALNPNGGNVGVGTTSPTTKLDINGQIRIRGGSPVAGYVLQSDANGLASWQPATSGLSGAGTANYIPVFTSATSIANSIIYSNGTKVGIGTTSLTGYLDVSFNLTNVSGTNIYAAPQKIITSTGTYYNLGIEVVPKINIGVGVTDSGYLISTRSYALRDVVADAGALNTLNALTVSYGHYNTSAASIVTDNAYGITISPYHGTVGSTIGRSIALWIQPEGMTGATVNSKWSLYNSNLSDSYFAGSVGIGTTAPQDRIHLFDAQNIRLTRSSAAQSILFYESASKDWEITHNADRSLKIDSPAARQLSLNPSGGAIGVYNKILSYVSASGTFGVPKEDFLLQYSNTKNAGIYGYNTFSSTHGCWLAFKITDDTNNLVTALDLRNGIASFGSTIYLSNASSNYTAIKTGNSITIANPSLTAAEGRIGLLPGMGIVVQSSRSTDNMAMPAFINPFGGSVGIGLSTVPSYLLHVKGPSTDVSPRILIQSDVANSYPGIMIQNDAKYWQIWTDGTIGDKFAIYDGTSYRFVIDVNGNVGIGSNAYNSPGSTLHVWNNDNGNSIARFRNSNSVMKKTYIQIEDHTGGLHDTIIGTNSVAGTSANSYSWFGVGGNEGIVISHAGLVGIGETNPNVKLQVGSSVEQVSLRIAGGSSVNQSPVLSLKRGGRECFIAINDLVSYPLGGMLIGNTSGLANYNDMTLLTNSNLVISSNGNVGIGILTPTHSLDVKGKVGDFAVVVYGDETISHSQGVSINAGTDASDYALYISNITSGDLMFSVVGNGDVGIGTYSPNIAGFYGSHYTFTTIYGKETNLSCGVLELSGASTNSTPGNDVGLISFSANSNASGKMISYISSALQGTTTNNLGGMLRFFTKADGSSMSETMTIRTKFDGISYVPRVGIGISEPHEVLHISANTPYSVGLKISNEATSESARFAIDSGKLILGTLTSQSLVFMTNGTEIAQFDWRGQLGIGQNLTPLTVLDVSRDDSSTTFATECAISIRNSNRSANSLCGINFSHSLYGYNHGYIGCRFTDTGGGANQGASDMIFAVRANNTSDNVTEYMRLKVGGKIGIGTTNPQQALHVIGSVRVSTLTTGTVYSDVNGVLNNTASDVRMKENVIKLTYGLTEIIALNPVFYNWNTSYFDGTKTINLQESKGSQKEIGLIAQEVKEVVPEIVGENYDGTLSLDYPKLVAVLINSVKELQEQITSLKAEVSELKKSIF